MSFEQIHYFNLIVGAGVIVLQLFSLAALFLLVITPKQKENNLLTFIKKHYIIIGFLISLSAVLVSETYSEIIGFVPCLRCWIDRIFIFPQAIIFAIAWMRKERNVIWYSLGLTIFGLINAIYHMYIYYYGEGNAPCDPSGVSCVQRLVSEFGGYISIPMNALSGFVALLVLALVVHFYQGDKVAH